MLSLFIWAVSRHVERIDETLFGNESRENESGRRKGGSHLFVEKKEKYVDYYGEIRYRSAFN